MRLRKSLLLILLPIPVALLSGYFIERLLFPYVAPLVEVKGKEIPQLPDIQISEEASDLEVIDALALIDLKEVKEERIAVERHAEKPPAYRLTFTFVGPEKNYAIVDGKLLTEGDLVSPEERIVKITRKGILLSGKWGRRWVYISK